MKILNQPLDTYGRGGEENSERRRRKKRREKEEKRGGRTREGEGEKGGRGEGRKIRKMRFLMRPPEFPPEYIIDKINLELVSLGGLHTDPREGKPSPPR